jgi:hypothetical protein
MERGVRHRAGCRCRRRNCDCCGCGNVDRNGYCFGTGNRFCYGRKHKSRCGSRAGGRSDTRPGCGSGCRCSAGTGCCWGTSTGGCCGCRAGGPSDCRCSGRGRRRCVGRSGRRCRSRSGGFNGRWSEGRSGGKSSPSRIGDGRATREVPVSSLQLAVSEWRNRREEEDLGTNEGRWTKSRSMLRFGIVVPLIPLIGLARRARVIGTSLPTMDDFADWADRVA